MNAASDHCCEALSAPPVAVLPHHRIGNGRLSSPNKAPSITVSLTIDDVRVAGAGSFAGLGDVVVKQPVVAEVERGTDTTIENADVDAVHASTTGGMRQGEFGEGSTDRSQTSKPAT